MSKLTIKKTDKTDFRKLLRSDDMLISMGDIAFGGAALGGDGSGESHVFASHIASLAHIITRIVLSDRLVFVSGEAQQIHLLPSSFHHSSDTVIRSKLRKI